MILDKHVSVSNFPAEFSELLLVVSPNDNEGSWQVVVVKDSQDSYTYHTQDKIKLPKDWAGLEDKELADVTGVEDAIFCHKGLFMCIARSKEGAIKLAKLALEA